MGKIRLTALQVRKRALAEIDGSGGRKPAPVWLDAIARNPPANILVRSQPIQHDITRVRTRALASGRTEQFALAEPVPRRSKKSKASRLFAPVQIRYEEDELRHQFFKDHPWELAQPRVVRETTGNQHRFTDWSKGLVQPHFPLSGESVVQRQLWLLENVPDMTRDQSYDIARREFYILRRQEQTARRVQLEEATHMGAEPERSTLEWATEIENKQYKDWEKWSYEQVKEQNTKNAAFGGAVAPPGEEKIISQLAGRKNTGPFQTLSDGKDAGAQEIVY